MTTVVEVGPTTVRGACRARAQWVSAGIEAIDDDLVLIDEHPVDVADVWRTILRDAVGGSVDTVTLVFPTWWSSARVERVRAAADSVAGDVMVMRRAQVLPDDRTVLIEAAPEFVVVSAPSGVVAVVRDEERLAAAIPPRSRVVVDVSDGQRAIADRLRRNGVDVTIAAADWVEDALATGFEEDRPKPRRGVTAVVAGTLLTVAALCGVYVARPEAPAATVPMTLLVEGRLGVMVPARWPVERITPGPGSARLQLVSPEDRDVALHITQSTLAPQQSGQQVEDALRRAFSEAPDGVFVDFEPAGERAGRAVLTYRETRADRHIDWFVLTDESLRIAIGCQSAPGREASVREACDEAIRSAHAVF
ncbi:type VII secretion-associated protein [Mycobacterium sp. ACS1612]|uniref:type VII secretion-associated protein n=1 Tax=Mycobacterium sp. ACS1612 TaxID=1834117 RepID=UPI0008000E03|nr:type VII secretion-associated protein [Mycobacterium sp. ACS1612]OBF42242.1 type VII secretion-associated protein [Mycobacterium sp. ACS1612]